MGQAYIGWKPEGTYTDATSVNTGYSAADYGVKRTDTGATVVDAGTGWTSVGTGQYKLSWTDPADDLSYLWHATLVYGGRTIRLTGSVDGGSTAVDGDLEYNDVWAEVSRYLGTGASPTGTALATAKRITQDAYGEFLMGMDPRTSRVYEWSFLYPSATVTQTSGSTTSSLPADFEGFYGPIAYGSSGNGIAVEERTPGGLDQLYAMGGGYSGTPEFYAIEPVGNSSGDHSRYRLKWYPLPGSTTTLHYHYRQEQDALSNKLQGIPSIQRAVKQLARARAAEQENDISPDENPERSLAEKYMAAAIDLDAAMKPHTLGYMGDNSDCSRVVERTGAVTYET